MANPPEGSEVSDGDLYIWWSLSETMTPRGFSQERALKALIGLDQPHFSLRELGKRLPKLSEALEVTVRDLFT